MTKATKSEFKELSAEDMAKGIGRTATGEELLQYLLDGTDEKPVNLDLAFSKYANDDNENLYPNL